MSELATLLYIEKPETINTKYEPDDEVNILDDPEEAEDKEQLHVKDDLPFLLHSTVSHCPLFT